MPLTKRLMTAGIMATIGILTCALPPVVQAQTRLQEKAEENQWVLAPGRVEAGIQLGGGYSFATNTRDATEYSFMPRIGYVFAEQNHFLAGSLEIFGEPMFLAVFQHQSVQVGGITTGLKYNFRTGTPWVPYIQGGVGLSYASHRLPHGGTNFNFMAEGGAGLQYAVTPRSLIGAEWRYQHFSNADISPPNPGLNMSVFLASYSYLF